MEVRGNFQYFPTGETFFSLSGCRFCPPVRPIMPAATIHTSVPDHTDLTGRMRDWLAGRGAGADATMDALARELAAIATRIMSRQPPGHTLQATALLNEFWLKLSQSESGGFRDRQHFMGLAVTTMRSIVVDHAKAKRAQKRLPKGARIELERVVNVLEDRGGIDLIDLNEALDVLGAEDAELLSVIELRFFGGLTQSETAELLGWSRAKVRSDETLACKRLARLFC